MTTVSTASPTTGSERSDPVSPDDSPISTSSEGSKSLKPEKKIMCLRARVAFLSKELEELTMSNLDYQQRLTTFTVTEEEAPPSPSSGFPADSHCAQELDKVSRNSWEVMKLEARNIYDLSTAQVQALEKENSKLRHDLNKSKAELAADLKGEWQLELKTHVDEMTVLTERNKELLEIIESLPDDGRKALVIENHRLCMQLADLKVENDKMTKEFEETKADHSVLVFCFERQTEELRGAIDGAQLKEERIRAQARDYDRLVLRYRDLFKLLNEVLEGVPDDEDDDEDDESDGGVRIEVSEEEDERRPVLRVVNGD